MSGSRKALLSAICLSLAFASSALAGFSDKTVAEWKSHGFNGDPQIPDPRPVVQDYVHRKSSGDGKGTCGEKIRDIVQATNSLGDLAFQSKDISEPLKRISNTLLASLDSGDDCFHDVASSYILAALLASERDYYASRHGAILKERYLPGNPQLFILAASLLNHGKIQLLTPGFRATLGPGWQESAKDYLRRIGCAATSSPEPSAPLKASFPSVYAVRGGFSCEGSLIYIDPFVAPIDLASNLVHEIDHLVRDKNTDPAKYPVKSWKTTLLRDEGLALTAGFHRQLRLLNTRIAVRGGSLTTYSVLGDRDLLLPGGPYYELWNVAVFSDKLANFDHLTFLSGGLAALAPGNAWFAKVYEQVSKVYSAVNDAYFPCSTLEPQRLRDLTSISADSSGNSVVAGLHNWPLETYYAWPIPHQGNPPGEWTIHRPWVQKGVTLELPMEEAFAAVDELEAKMTSPSVSCQSLIAASDDPEVAAYAGSHLSGPGSHDPIHPGGQGGVKGGEPVRACYLLND